MNSTKIAPLMYSINAQKAQFIKLSTTTVIPKTKYPHKLI